ncbi:MAG: DUF3016 domain-containing protein [Verrucomicrobia bacterium]|nr:DUF3016 domain-containing protein [Verrucomicrobiota bacterium]
MRPALYASCAIGLLVGGLGCATQGTGGGGAVASAVVTVQYTNPQSFTDFRVQGRDVQYSTSTFTGEVTRTLEPVMASQFPGYRLTLQFTNIDLAGQRTTGPRSVRVVRTRHPARLSFNYVLQDKSGKAAASGSRTLVQTSTARGPSASGTVGAETQMLQRWLRGLSVTR